MITLFVPLADFLRRYPVPLPISPEANVVRSLPGKPILLEFIQDVVVAWVTAVRDDQVEINVPGFEIAVAGILEEWTTDPETGERTITKFRVTSFSLCHVTEPDAPGTLSPPKAKGE